MAIFQFPDEINGEFFCYKKRVSSKMFNANFTYKQEIYVDVAMESLDNSSNEDDSNRNLWIVPLPKIFFFVLIFLKSNLELLVLCRQSGSSNFWILDN